MDGSRRSAVAIEPHNDTPTICRYKPHADKARRTERTEWAASITPASGATITRPPGRIDGPGDRQDVFSWDIARHRGGPLETPPLETAEPPHGGWFDAVVVQSNLTSYYHNTLTTTINMK